MAASPEPTLLPGHLGRCWVWLLLVSTLAVAQVCETAADMDGAVKTALETTARRYFDLSARGDANGLKQNSIASVAANFAGIEAAIQENQAAFSGANVTNRPPFLLSATGDQPLARAEFLCGVFGPRGQTKDSAVFVFPNLPPGKYAVVILDVAGAGAAETLTLVLAEEAGVWKLAGYYVRSVAAAGHDAAWFVQRAEEFKGKSETHNAFLYYREAVALASAADFMSTLASDRIYDELQATQPADFPINGKAIDLLADGKTYHVTEVFPLAVGNDIDVVIKYQSADISDSSRTFLENTAVIKAFVGKFPELRDGFAAVVARAVDPTGRDYGTLVRIRETK